MKTTTMMRLKLPVMEKAEAMGAGYASIAHPVAVSAEAGTLLSMDEGMRQTASVWVKAMMQSGAPALELYRKRTELKGDGGITGRPRAEVSSPIVERGMA